MEFKQTDGQNARWLEEYDITVIHRPGKDHGNADFLSRPVSFCARDRGVDLRELQELQNCRAVALHVLKQSSIGTNFGKKLIV